MNNLQRNSNSLDRTVRLVIGIALTAVAFPGMANVLTTLTGWCPVYALAGIASLKKPSVEK